MKRQLRRVRNLFAIFGLDLLQTVKSVSGLPSYVRDFLKLRRQKVSSVRIFPFGKPYPCLADRVAESGNAKGHYFHQDLLVARRVYLNNPTIHLDVGSRIDGFVAHVASFRQIHVIDIRPLPINPDSNIRFIRADVMAPLRDDLVNYCDSLSSLHALEHFGLGRYGDAVTYDGYLLGMNNLHKILKKDGTLYLSVPIGPR